ncbi:hypothetical protein JCM11251_001797 [Rhodosporidiobolus azoricus]
MRGMARLEVEDSLLDEGSRFSVGGMSTREPLSQSAKPHPLLPHLHSLLSSLSIPLTLSSLAIVTPSLLLTILEALLETRIDDVPDSWRGSWAREHRRGVVEALVRAMEEVVQGLTRAFDESESRRRLLQWRGKEVDVGQVVRGKEEDVAKLVAGLLDIAEAMGIATSDGSGNEFPVTSTPLYHSPSTSVATPRPFPSPSIAPSTLSSTCTPTPLTLFAPRPLHAPRRRQSPPAASSSAATRAASLATSTSASSATSLHSHSSSSTSVTVPSHPRSSASSRTSHRPSLVAELAKSGYLSPPPGSPRRQRVPRSSSTGQTEDLCDSTSGYGRRSTLALLKRLEQERLREQQAAERVRNKQALGGIDVFVGDQQLSSPNNAPKGKERETRVMEEDPFLEQSGYSSEAEQTESCCEGCGSSMRETRRKAGGGTEGELSSASSSSSSRPTSSGPSSSHEAHHERPHKRVSRRRSPPPVTPHPSNRHRLASAVPPCTCRKPPTSGSPPNRSERSRKMHRQTADHASTNEAPATISPPAPSRRVRVVRSSVCSSTATATPANHRYPTSDSAQYRQLGKTSVSVPIRSKRPQAAGTGAREGGETGDLSVHGESEIEAFERLRLGHQRPQGPPVSPDLAAVESSSANLPSDPARAPLHPAPSTPQPTFSRAPAQAQAETPSPHTLMLLAQRDRLREKLAALQRRERDRLEAASGEVSGGGIDVAWEIGVV